MKNWRNNSGQIALVLVLVMTVIASAAVAISARTTVETRVQEINVDSSQAMLAAESGLEQVLKTAPTGNLSGNLDANTSFQATDLPVASGENIYQGLKRGETVEIITSGIVPAATGITLNWKHVGDDPSFTGNRGILVSVTNNTTGVVTDSAIVSLAPPPQGFIVAGASVEPGFTYATNIDVTNSRLVTVMVLGGDIDLGFKPIGGNLPSQIRAKQVVGAVTRGSGATAETVKYGIDYRESVTSEVPEVFQYAVFSGESISQ